MEMFLKLPEDDCKAPRDGVTPCKTGDVMFLAALLRRGGNARYFVETNEGTIIPEMECLESADVKSRIRRATVRGWFRDGYYPFRSILTSGNARSFKIRFNKKKLRSAKRWARGEPWTLGKSLKWPFAKGHDPLLGNLHKIPLLNWQDSLPLSKGEVFCPLDGQVLPVKAEIITAPITWQHLCGRHWRVMLCPLCLGQFRQDVLAMN